MNTATIIAFAAVAWLAILTPGPAVFLALRNGVGRGVRAAMWSSLGNVCGVFLVSGAAMLGLGALFASSASVFAVAKLLGAGYLFYLGARHLFGRATALVDFDMAGVQTTGGGRLSLYREGLFLATTNPKAILFFTALFPQFVDTRADLLAQFLVLTCVFMVLSFTTLVAYAALARQAKTLLIRQQVAVWVNRVFGVVFVGFAALLLTFRKPVG